MAAQSLQVTSLLRPATQRAIWTTSNTPESRNRPNAALRAIKGQKLSNVGLCLRQARSAVGTDSTSFFGQHCKPRDLWKTKRPRRGKRAISMVTTESEKMEVGSRAPDFTVGGQRNSLCASARCLRLHSTYSLLQINCGAPTQTSGLRQGPTLSLGMAICPPT